MRGSVWVEMFRFWVTARAKPSTPKQTKTLKINDGFYDGF